jgi:heptose-I-phosphate ethanolaminephosphotransferase
MYFQNLKKAVRNFFLIKKYENLKRYSIISFFISLLAISPLFIYFRTINIIFFYVAVVFLLFFISFFNKFLFIILTIYVAISSSIIFSSYLKWGIKHEEFNSLIEVIIYSNPKEIIEYLESYISIIDLPILLYFIVLITLLIKLFRTPVLNYLNIKILSTISVTLLIVSLSYITKDKVPFYKIEPLSLASSINDVINKSKKFNLRNITINSYKRKHKVKNLIYDKVIIVLGESVNKNFMGIYNEEFQTTPFLDSIKDELFIFNVISPATQTHNSIPLMFTTADYKNPDLFLKKHSIITDFNLSGFKTFWISNQEGRNLQINNPITSIAKESNYTYFTVSDSFKSPPDFVLLDQIQTIEKEQAVFRNKMYTIHLMGSHSSYDKRYEKKSSLFINPVNLSEEYQNTIHYTDKFFRELFNIIDLNNENTLLIYTSDHGEAVNNKNGGHGNFEPSKDEVEVPFIVYSNIKNPRIDELLVLNKIKLFNNSSFYSIVNYLSNINDSYDISNSPYIIAQSNKNLKNYFELINFK